MDFIKIYFRNSYKNERGSALVMAILASFILGAACIALLSALGPNSRNSTDVLSETKAYYAAESGLQATINKLRYDCSATYGAAKANPSMSNWLPYNGTTADGTSAVVIGQTAAAYNAAPLSGSAFTINVSDPDNIGGTTTFSTSGKFLPTVVVGNSVVNIQGTLSSDSKSVTYGTLPDRTTVSILDQASTPIDFSAYSNPQLTTFQIVNEGNGATITDVLRYDLNYQMSVPRSETKTLIGTLQQSGSTITATFKAREYTLMGSVINVCATTACTGVTYNPCVATTPTSYPVTLTKPLPSSTASTNVYANVTPVQPVRIVVKSTGFGPNRSLKKLEAIIQRNFLDNLGSGPAFSMVGPACPTGQTCFSLGTSSGVTYSGASGPAFGTTDPTNLAYIATHPPGPSGGSQTQMTPPPELITDLPSWQYNATTLNAKIQEYRLAAQGSGTYYTGGGTLPYPPGNNATGTGITFCEGDCKVAADGGGILVVTGQLTNVGDFDFRGLIIVTGVNGWLRNGGGSGVIRGSVVIAPYDPINLGDPNTAGAGFLPPRYAITGGGSSDVIATDLDTAYDGTGAATDFVQGVAEK